MALLVAHFVSGIDQQTSPVSTIHQQAGALWTTDRAFVNDHDYSISESSSVYARLPDEIFRGFEWN